LENPLSGHCYVAAEALWHLIGGKKSGFVPQVLSHGSWPKGLNPGETHWFLRRGRKILDPTAGQFETEIDYDKGRGTGFLTREPSNRAKTVMERVQP
jgi:phage gp45-like